MRDIEVEGREACGASGEQSPWLERWILVAVQGWEV